MDVALKADCLEVIRGDKKVLSGMSFEVREGEVFALLGGNGAGKSTTLLTFMGILKPSGGAAEVLGFSLHIGQTPCVKRSLIYRRAQHYMSILLLMRILTISCHWGMRVQR